MNIVCCIYYCRNRFLNLTWNHIEPLQRHFHLLRFVLTNDLHASQNLHSSSAVLNSSGIFEIWQCKHNIFVMIIKQIILISFVVCRYVYTCSGIIVIQIELSTGISMETGTSCSRCKLHEFRSSTPVDELAWVWVSWNNTAHIQVIITHFLEVKKRFYWISH